MKKIPALLGLAGVILGAMGAHLLKPQLAAAGTLDAWQTAAHYHLLHAVVLAAAALALITDAAQRRPALARWLRRAMLAWTTGIVLFSGSIYWLALGGPRWLGPVTPLGGFALMLGWAFLFAAACAKDKGSQNP